MIVTNKVNLIGASPIGAVMGVGIVTAIAPPAEPSFLPEVANTSRHLLVDALAESILVRAEAIGGEVVAEIPFFGTSVALTTFTTLTALASFSSGVIITTWMWNEGKESCRRSLLGGGLANALFLSIVPEFCDKFVKGQVQLLYLK